MGFMNSLLRRKSEGAPGEQPKVERKADPPTPLMLLLPDASGIASYHLNVFPSAKAAEFYLDSTLRGQVQEGAVLFWALSWEPASHPDCTQAEPLVVIRDNRKAAVYPFSFAGIDSAMEFIRYEMNRGLDLGQVMVFFAVPARIEVDFWGRSTIIPSAAPVRSFQPRRVEDMARVATPAPEPARPVHEPLADDTRYLNEADIAEVVQMAREIIGERPAATDADARVLPMPRRSTASANGNHAVRSDAEPRADPIEFTPAAQKVHEARASLAVITAWANFSQAIDEALDVYVAHQVFAKLVWNRLCRAIREAMAARRRVLMLACWQALTNAFASAAEALHTRGDGVDFRPLEAEEKRSGPQFGMFEMGRAGNRRWEPREERFEGFGSPPGRFHHRTHEKDTII